VGDDLTLSTAVFHFCECSIQLNIACHVICIQFIPDDCISHFVSCSVSEIPFKNLFVNDFILFPSCFREDEVHGAITFA
jgi:hypothetical protein